MITKNCYWAAFNSKNLRIQETPRSTADVPWLPTVKDLLQLFLFISFAAVLSATSEPGDDLLSRARELAANHMRPEAIAMLEDYLREHPSDVDARVLCGLILSWEGRYNDAREQLR